MRSTDPTDQGHRRIDEGNLAYHRAVASHLRTHPEAVQQALSNLDRWEQQRGHRAYFDTWRRLLTDLPVEELADVITADNAQGRELRQTTPFAGILSEADRLRILRG